MRVGPALVAGLALLAIAIAITLTRSPPTVAWSDSTPSNEQIAQTRTSARACQADEVLPPGASAARLSLFAVFGPRVSVAVLSGGRVLTSGVRGAGWTGGAVTVPLRPLRRGASHVKLCFALGPMSEVVELIGSPASPAEATTAGDGRRLPGRMRIEFLKPGRRSWWSLASSVARRMGLGHTAAGTWVVLLLAAAMATVLAGASWLTVRGAARIPRAAAACALLAFLNAACWSLISPPFQVPDEPDHFAYVQQLAETGRLPDPTGRYSPEEGVALSDLRYERVRLRPMVHTISSRAQQRTLEGDLSRPLARRGPGGAGNASSEPPLYYALQTIPYDLGSNGTILDRLELMRLLSALMGALTALFAFLFLREALPGVPWAWTVGGLGVALAPLLGFVSGAVNPDALLFAVSAALFYCLARAFRRGLTRRLAIVIGVAIAAGFMTKLNFVGLAPGAILGLILLARRQARSTGWSVYYRSLAPALLIALSPVLLYALVNAASDHPPLGVVSNGIGSLTDGQTSISHELSYIWQLYLPRLPWMHGYFGEVLTTRQIWFNRLIGLYGWLDTVFPGWVYDAALLPAGLIGALCVRALALGRPARRRRAAALTVYAAMSLGVLMLIGAGGYTVVSTLPAEYAQPRYLLPLLALWGAVLALAARGAGRRWGPVAGALIVVLALAHDIFSQLQLIARYYG